LFENNNKHNDWATTILLKIGRLLALLIKSLAIYTKSWDFLHGYEFVEDGFCTICRIKYVPWAILNQVLKTQNHNMTFG
jgi:hypothetical protein